MCSIVFSNAAVAVLAVLAAFLARPLLSFWRKWHVLGRLPSPPVSDPVWGHFSNIAAETAHLEFKTWAKELGPCFLLRLLHLPMLVVTEPVSLTHVYGFPLIDCTSTHPIILPNPIQ